MARTVVGLFDTLSEAQHVVNDLVNAGFKRDDISLVANDARNEYSSYLKGGSTASHTDDAVTADEGAGFGAVVGGLTGILASLGALAIPGIGPVIAAGPLVAALTGGTIGAVAGAATGGIVGGLVKTGISEEDAQAYAEGVRRGGTLLVVNAPDNMAQQAMDIMNRHDAVDVHERMSEWRTSGWKGFDANAEPYTDTTRATAKTTQTSNRMTDQGKTVLPVVEEELQVGKREVERGGVRVEKTVTEKPVEEKVNLREERVTVERRPVDRPADTADINNAFKETTIEMTEKAEEAVVNKQARVVEEVVVGKEVTNRTETIRDTVKRTDVDVQQTGGTSHTTMNQTGSMSGADFDTWSNDFNTHYTTNYGTSGRYTYDQYMPAYRYGYELASNKNYKDWNSIENDVRTRWEERNKGTWEDFKDAIRYAWDKVRGKDTASTAR